MSKRKGPETASKPNADFSDFLMGKVLKFNAVCVYIECLISRTDYIVYSRSKNPSKLYANIFKKSVK